MNNSGYYVITIIMLFLGMIFSIKLDVLFGSSLSIHELQEAKKIFIMLLVNIAITLLSNIYTSIITANENFIFLKLLSIFQITIQPAAIIAVLLFTPRAFLIVVVQTLFNLLAALIKYFYCRFGIDDKIKYHYYDKNLIKGMLSFSMSIFIVSIVDQVFWKSNQIILGITAGTAIVAVYSIAAQIYMNYMPLSTVIQSVFLPSITRIAAQKGNDRILSNHFIRIGRIQFIFLATILFGFTVYGKEFIILWVGQDYIEVYWIALIILLPFTIDLIQNLGLTIMQAKNLYSFRAKLFSFMAILNIILSFQLSSILGAIGAAVATGIVMFLGYGLIMNIYYYKIVRIDIPAFWKEIFYLVPIYFPSIVVGTLLKEIILINSWFSLFINIVFFLLITIFFMWIKGFNSYEKNLVTELLSSMKEKDSLRNEGEF